MSVPVGHAQCRWGSKAERNLTLNRNQRSDDTPTMLGQGEALEEVKSLGRRTDSLDVLDAQGAVVIAARYASLVFNSSTLVCQASSSGATPEGRFRRMLDGLHG
jgi:hypothetical protein